MAGFVRWFNTGMPTHWNPILRAIVAHFYVVSIHPFGDGNGRTSRAVESFLLYKAGVNVRGYYSLSNYYYQNRSEYIDSLNRVRPQEAFNLTPFVIFALKGLVQELEAVHEELLEEVRIIAFRDYAREILDRAGKLGTPAGAKATELFDSSRRQFSFAERASLRRSSAVAPLPKCHHPDADARHKYPHTAKSHNTDGR